MPDTATPLLDRAARFAAMATAESESLVTELADELRRVMAERDVYRHELWRAFYALARKDGAGPAAGHRANKTIAAVRKAAGLNHEDTDQ